MSAQLNAKLARSGGTLLLVLVAHVLPQAAGAGAIRVPTTAANLQLAIDEAAPGDTIFVEPGIYAGASNRNLNFRGKDLVVLGIEGAEATIIDCGGNEAEPARGFIFESGEPRSAIVAGLTIRNGYRTSNLWPDATGGGMLIRHAGTRPTIKHCTFENNYSSETGGGITVAEGASPTVSACRFMGNTGRTGGGGILLHRADGVVVECEFIGNRSAQGEGGAFMSFGVSAPILRACRFQDNSALSGGAIALKNSNPAIVAECTFLDNRATRTGGAIQVAGGAELTLSRCLFVNNAAATEAGAVRCGRGTIDLVACTLFGNASTSGAGICVKDNGVVMATTTIIAFGQRGEAIASEGSGVAMLRCCNVFGNESGDWVGHIAPQQDTNGNMADDPLFCNVGTNNFYLAETSPCAPPRSGSCGVIGRFEVACVSTVEETTWGAIKANYRR